MFCYPFGSRVRLASGGPSMLVVDVHPERAAVTCAWLDQKGAREAFFPAICLDLERIHHNRADK